MDVTSCLIALQGLLMLQHVCAHSVSVLSVSCVSLEVSILMNYAESERNVSNCGICVGVI